jgi:hypothetical protein
VPERDAVRRIGLAFAIIRTGIFRRVITAQLFGGACDHELVSSRGKPAQVDHRKQRGTVGPGVIADFVTQPSQWLAIQVHCVQIGKACKRRS